MKEFKHFYTVTDPP